MQHSEKMGKSKQDGLVTCPESISMFCAVAAIVHSDGQIDIGQQRNA